MLTIHEADLTNKIINAAADAVSQNCNLEKIKQVAGQKQLDGIGQKSIKNVGKLVTIGVAYDNSFCFYYPENLDALREAGAKLVFFNTMKDQNLPEVDAYYIGGGFPESFLRELEDNASIREQLKQRIEQDVPVYAECGGLMYLTRSIEINGIKKNMVGAFPADVCFQKKPVGHGYIHLEPIQDKSWLASDSYISGHEFHYSKLTHIGSDIEFCYRVKRGVGVDKVHDGLVYRNVLASYAHLHSLAVPQWAVNFVDFILRHKSNG